ncbi:MAG: YezD family protein [Lachnospiraceae bacterium]|nr:YezD family protein [Lachnospiraceae bacterium]
MAEIKKVSDEELEKIRKLIESLKYGSVNIIIQDGKIVQIEKNEKIRL